MDNLPCPKCGCSVCVPLSYDQGEHGKHSRSCNCDPFPEFLDATNLNLGTLSQKLHKIEQYIQIFWRCFPHASFTSSAPWSDLDVDLSRIPDAMKERAIKRFGKTYPAIDARIMICKYCGDTVTYGSNGHGDGVMIAGVGTCNTCELFRKESPSAFAFVTRIFQWIYGEPEPSPPAVLPIPTPEPKPVPEPKNERNIVL